MADREQGTEGRERAADASAPMDEALDAQLDAEDHQTEAATDTAQATVPKIGKDQVGRGGRGKPLH